MTEDTVEACTLKARPIRAGFLEAKKIAPRLTLERAIKDYIAANDSVLSPSTIDGYKRIQQNHFKDYQQSDIASADWQRAVNIEARQYSPKSVYNAWGLVAAVMRSHGMKPPKVTLPAKESRELPWLNYEQIQVFLKAIYGQPCEMAALLALHSLRKSELLCITPGKVDAEGIHVDGAKVYVEHGLVEKKTNKTSASKRVVPVMIPRLKELFDESALGLTDPYVQVYHHTIYKQINEVCEAAGLPKVGYHGLRRSFASLAYHLGWSERQAMAIGE